MCIFRISFLHLIKVPRPQMQFDFYSGVFHQRGIENLVERWEYVVDNNGEYIIG